MSTSTFQSVSLLPVYLQTSKNAKFLSSTIDQLIQPAQLEKLNSYIGSTSTPTYKSGDSYVVESSTLRQAYQLDPALVVYDAGQNVQDVIAIDDLANEIAIKGGDSSNFDRLFRSSIYGYDPRIDWDKLINYQNYYWLPNGPEVINIDTANLNVDDLIVGQPEYSNGNLTLLNGMIITFSGVGVASKYLYRDFYVEGVGTSITLIPTASLITPEAIASVDPEAFDVHGFDTLTFDNNKKAPVNPEYITINRASKDRNPWSRYNRWVSAEVIEASANANNSTIKYPESQRAKRPIIEFVADIKLYNFGSVATAPVDLIDTSITNATATIHMSLVNTTTNQAFVSIDDVKLEYGMRVVFTKDENASVKNKIYQVDFINDGGVEKVSLVQVEDPIDYDDLVTFVVTHGTVYTGTSWWYDSTNTKWVIGQKHTKLNTGPLFDLFDDGGISYSDKSHYMSTFAGNKIFGYEVGSGVNDPVLGFPLSYRNTNAASSFLFYNYYGNNSIPVATSDLTTVYVPTSSTYFKIGNAFVTTWPATYTSPELTVNSSGHYDVPLSLTNNPLNSDITAFTLSDLVAQNATSTRLMVSHNPVAFASMFIGKAEHNVIDAITKSADAYNQFKFSLVTQSSQLSGFVDAASALDEILANINASKTTDSPYFLSDMLGYGGDKKIITYVVSTSTTASITYPLTTEFDLGTASNRSVLIYKNGEQLIYGIDYSFDTVDAGVTISADLTAGDVITINEYSNTNRNFIPPTPTKLGLYPAFEPKLYLDDTYVTPTQVIQGHDGSILVAFNDYRDAIILEYEKRVYNNIKVNYRYSLLDINITNPGAFRDVGYSIEEINNIAGQDFIRWSGVYNIDYAANAGFDASNPFTWNYSGSYNELIGQPVNGSWRSLYKYFYGTDRPHTNPWEMLGFGAKPDWWDSIYTTDYSSTNTQMWDDLESGYIAGTATTSTFYARPGLNTIIPVNDSGELLDPTQIPLVDNVTPYDIRQGWAIGDQGPAETAWRRSSVWPFVMQKIVALTKPADYASLMYDPANMNISPAGYWSYGVNHTFLTLSDMPVHGENGNATSGYSVFVSEIGQQRTQNYITELREDLSFANFNLFHKVGGFVSQDNLQVIIDAYEPTTTSASAIVPNENYKLILNTSNPIRSIGISGLIIQRVNGEFVVKGYDRQTPYFTYFAPIRNAQTPAITVGGTSASYINWSPSGTSGATNLSNTDLTSAAGVSAGIFYQQGQIVKYGSNFYRVTVSHQAGATFNTNYFQVLDSLPTTGGASVQTAAKFSSTPIRVPYGVTYKTTQEVYDLIIGYGAWLTSQGFVFDEYNADLDEVIDWNLSGKEFLYWSTQNWIDNSLISLSPFADQLTYRYNDSVVENIFDSFYEYGIYSADGTPFPKQNLFVARQSGIFTINPINTGDGIYYARLNSVQKEHGMVFDNKTMFGDVIYDVETGERQRRMKLVGFRTANWNGDFFSPGFVYDQAKISTWKSHRNYIASDVVMYNGLYYSALRNIEGTAVFDVNQWTLLGTKPVAGLLPNLDYKITSFNDFYSLDIDSFDTNQQQAAQNLTGYTPRNYLNSIFTDPVSQYKFYQGYIREKGTKNAVDKLGKASLQGLNSKIDFSEEWAFRVGQYGSFRTYNEFEVPMTEGSFVENPQIINFVDTVPAEPNDVIHYVTPNTLTLGYGTIPRFVSTSSSDIIKLGYAGYVRLSDVTATAYDQNSILDIADNNQLNVGDTIWLGYTPNSDWDVYRYTFVSAKIIDAHVTTPYSQLTITTSAAHSVSNDDFVSIVGVDSTVDGIYKVELVTSPTTFIVATTLDYTSFIFPTTPGRLFKFASARFNTFDNIPDDTALFRYSLGTKLWVDSGNKTTNNGWAVYEKVVNHKESRVTSFGTISASANNQSLGYSISKRKGDSTNLVIVGAPTYTDTNGNSGRVNVYKKYSDKLELLTSYSSQQTNSLFGQTVVYDDLIFDNSKYGLIFAGAPGAESVRISSLDANVKDQTKLTISNPSAAGNFGSSIFVQRNTSTKAVLISAPSNTGTVYSYTVSVNSATVTASSATIVAAPTGADVNSNWGYAIVGSDNASIYAISAPGFNSNTGLVVVYNNNVATTIASPFNANAKFGQTMAMSADGSYLAISAPLQVNATSSLGAVAIYTLTNNVYVLDQTIIHPVTGNSTKFGEALDFNADSNVLVITALGTSTSALTSFDSDTTTFDENSTYFYASETGSGSAYLYSRVNRRFVFSEELMSDSIVAVSGTDYGTSVAVDNGVVFVGFPAITSGEQSGVYQFNQTDLTFNGWNPIGIQDDLVALDNVQEIKLIDTFNNSIINYYDYYDPLKGKIPDIAEKELTYKTSVDPAIYSVGTNVVNINSDTCWLDDHVGELWWDLSTARYVWYEQGDLEYRRNNWGKVFPGSTIDVYEWVSSSLLPSDWAVQADTSSGVALGISGQPKHPDNTVLGVKQVYDSLTGSFSNVYYFWVKNKVIVPNVKNRASSAYSVATLIADPSAAGLQFAAVISPSSIMLANVATELVSDNISLNIASDSVNSEIPRHTEWAILQEGSRTSSIPSVIERKMIDSLMGFDSTTGDLVPDPKLPERAKYGIDFTPQQQTLFADRFEALRNIVEFVNEILINVQITGNYSFDNLNAVDTASGDQKKFNTPLYWHYVDWASIGYNKYKSVPYTIDEEYQLQLLPIVAGEYVKIKNRGDGNYIILERVADNVVGNFGNDFDVVYIQNGTIQIGDNLWNQPYGWDETYSFDQTLFDQLPGLEIYYILQALKNDIFINELKVNWNLVFFKAIKYAFTEQTSIDWAFKTSLIDVTNFAGELNQPATYRLKDSAFYEEYLNEVKPYRTQVRKFTTNFVNTETSETTVTDFDFPSYYDPVTGKFVTPIVTSNDVENNPIRAVTGTLLFDRFSTQDSIGDLPVVDNFIGNGGLTEFVLSWAAQPNISFTATSVLIDGGFVPPSEYKLINFTKTKDGHKKKYTKLKFTLAPELNAIITINYLKSVELMNAAERITNFYSPTASMPAKQFDLLMAGVNGPAKRIKIDGNAVSTFTSHLTTYTGSIGMWGTVGAANWSGINPADIIIDGDSGFITALPDPNLEELIPGFMADTLAMDVYTKSSSGAPIIFDGSVNVNASNRNSTYPLSVLPTTPSSISVIYNGILFDYRESQNWNNSRQFTIDWANSTLVIPAQSTSGLLSYTIVGVGDVAESGVGIIDKVVTICSGTLSTQVVSLASFESVSSVYVTVNGQIIDNIPNSSYYYILSSATNQNNRAAVNILNLNANQSYAVQVWFFNSPVNYFNRIREQNIALDVQAFGTGTQLVTTLAYPPNAFGPKSSQAIVEILRPNTPIQRLRPPDYIYHTVTDASEKIYGIRADSPAVPFVADTANANVLVYINGKELIPGIAFDYVFDSFNITLNAGILLEVGDTITIEAFNPITIGVSGASSERQFVYDFRIDGNQLFLSPNITLSAATVRVITYADQDSLLMETQRFVGNPAGIYKMDRPIMDSKYVWATIVKSDRSIPLVNGDDFQVLDDNVTIILSDNFIVGLQDTVIIESFSSSLWANNIIGYRQFNDILGGTSFTRLSAAGSTYLTAPLSFTDTEIYVADSTKLTQPIVSENLPGVIIIAGERIEFFQVTGNVLGQLRRSTLGTSPAFYLESGTKVLDQGSAQTINFADTVLIQNTFTNTLTNVYTISTASQSITYPGTTNSVVCDGITFSSYIGIPAKDQVEVYYGGNLLKKDGRYVQDTTVKYDGIAIPNEGFPTVATVSALPVLANVGDAYLVTATNQVWVHTLNSFESTSTQLYADSGLRYVDPDFTIDIDTQQVTLNTALLGPIQENVQLTIVMKQNAVVDKWNDVISTGTTKSLLDSTSDIAMFLKAGPAVLPDAFFYGGDPNLTDDSGTILTDEQGNPIRGI